uniref:OTU domain-containing protein n=1 Tax=Plectus sambesii TaxID=2011161 RepID=A0A914X6U7_9BILA
MAKQLEENFTRPYINHHLTKANTAYLMKMDGMVLKKMISCARLKLFIDKLASAVVTIIINKKIVADGNCLFRAFSFCLTGSESHHLTVRRVLCDYIEFYPSTWQPLVGTRTIAKYLDRGVRTSGIGREHWGTKIEILAFANMFNCMIYVYNDHDSARNIKQYEGYGP